MSIQAMIKMINEQGDEDKLCTNRYLACIHPFNLTTVAENWKVGPLNLMVTTPIGLPFHSNWSSWVGP